MDEQRSSGERMNLRRLVFRVSAVRRMFAKRIMDADVRYTLATGEIIAQFPPEEPYPARVMEAFPRSRPTRVILAEDAEGRETVILTAYVPAESLEER